MPRDALMPARLVLLEAPTPKPIRVSRAQLARIIRQELADVVYPFEISYDFAVESQIPRIQRPHPP